MKTHINSLVGFYQFKSPYHQDKRLLPFKVIGHSQNSKYPLQVETIEYKGETKTNLKDNYKIEVVQDYITTGFLTKVEPADLNPLFIDQIKSYNDYPTI